MNASASYVLNEQQENELRRLVKMIKRPKKFNLIFVEYNDQALRRYIIQETEKLKYQTSATLDLSPESLPNVALFEENLRHLAEDYSIIHVYNLESHTDEDDFLLFLHEINFHRERIANSTPANIIFWVLEYQIKQFITQAPDFWSWNSAAIRFHSEKISEGLEPIPEDHAIAELNMPETRHRIQSLIDFLKPKDLGSLKDAEKGLLNELIGYRKNIAVFEKNYGFLDSQLQTMQESINEILNKVIDSETNPGDLPNDMNLEEEIRFVANQLSVKAGESRIDKARWTPLAERLLENVEEENEEVGKLANNLVLIYLEMGDVKNALTFAKKDLEISERTLQPDHPSLATSY
ncbi:MAG: tetratricopeptide repeat protein, partial [Candidatus Latescibacteria bacterium]|nr:tetratricopeptide repeat protein [Candidatus Latescibacterota bacterium]